MTHKTYSFGVTFKSEDLKGFDTISQEIHKSLQKAQRNLERKLFLNGEKVQIPSYVHEMISCEQCYWTPGDKCVACYGRDRHPVPMSELYGFGKLIET